MDVRILSISAMKHGETRIFEFIRNDRPAQGFLIRYYFKYYAYLNMCRHWPVPLDLGDGDFFSVIADRIMCKSHGAVYQPESGICDYGPCVKAELEGYPVKIEGEDAVVTCPN